MRIPIRAALGAVSAVLVLGAAGCGSNPAPAPAPRPAAAPPPAAPAPSAGSDAGATDLPTAPAAPMTWDSAAQTSAVAAATTVVNAYLRKDLAPAAWWGNLTPYLTGTAQADYAGTDLTQVPGTRVRKGAQAAPGDQGAAYLAVVAVPTDAGVYTVLLERGPEVSTDATHWLASKVTPPHGQ